MSSSKYDTTSFSLSKLVADIEHGEVALPDLQRPFVWPNTKVRDLFDSMYRGYPVGYLLLWATAPGVLGKGIGMDAKQLPAQRLVIDGQQRLTSLYAVFRGKPVLRQGFETERIQIAFNPLEESFQVADAAIRRDPNWIPDISSLWDETSDLFDIVGTYMDKLPDLEEEDRKRARQAIQELHHLGSYNFTALILSAEISEEEVGEVFVRINSKGTPLNQADFILTLMSVFRDKQRKELESFCRSARTPARGTASPFNHFIEPEPSHLLRVAVALAFRRARLAHVYSILRGKDLETGEFSIDRREEQFDALQAAQDYALDIEHWQDYVKCLLRAGFRSGKFISSTNTLVFAYAFYLIGRRDYGLRGSALRDAIARWVFFALLTGRYTSAGESQMEEDLANLRSVETGDDFLAYIDQTIGATFTPDYWSITLPSELVSSTARSPALFAYYAALNLLDARALFSDLRVAELMDPVVQGVRSSLERHHLFPRAYLLKNGVRKRRDTNQIANFALIEWEANCDISAEAPAEYWPRYQNRVGDRARYWHALPEGWESMDYPAFLKMRRERIAEVVRDGFRVLSGAAEGSETGAAVLAEEPAPPPSLEELWLARLSAVVRPLVEGLMDEPPQELDETTSQVEEYLQALERYRRFEPNLDIDTARRVADGCLRLIGQARASGESGAERLAQVASLYFILDDDAESDVRSPRGFDDDLEVVEEALAVLSADAFGEREKAQERVG